MEGADNASAQPQATKFCSNCKRNINAGTFELHESHCRRHITLCEICEEPVPIREKDEHFQECHAPKPCPSCGEQVPKDKMEDHEDKCPERMVECKYCELDVKHKEYGDHVDACGSRTDYCELCGQRVMLKDMDEHKMAKCASVRAESPLDQHTLDNLEGLTPPHAYEHRFGTPPLAYEDQFGDENGYGFSPFYHYGNGYGYYGDHYDNEYGRYGDAHVHERSPSPVEVHTRPTDPQPLSPPPYTADDNVHVDPQWLQTVAEACGEEDLDRVLAQNMFYMNVKQATARDEYVPIEREVVEEGMAADRQRDYEQQQVHKDEDLARRLQHEYDSKLAEEKRDAEMARQLQQQLLQQSSKVPRSNDTRFHAPDLHQDAELARKLQDEEDNRVSYQRRRTPPSPPAQDDAELARILQEEESRNSAKNYRQGGVATSSTLSPGGSHSNTPAYVPNNEHTLPPYNETTQGAGYEVSHPNPSGYDFQSRPYSPHSSLHGDDEQPRAKTPPSARRHKKNERGSTSEGDSDEEKIPCQFCQKLIPFSQIMYHQKQCTADCMCPRCSLRRSCLPSSPQQSTGIAPTKQYNVDALLRKNSPDEDHSPENTVPCQFCGDPFTENLIIPHQALCEHNPDKHLKDAYRPEPTPRLRPQPHPSGGLVSLQRLPLHPGDEDPEIPCEFCGEGFPSSQINAHQPTCTKNLNFRSLMQQQALGTPSPSGFVSSSEGVPMGPCESCGRQLPLTDLIKHETTCRLHHHHSLIHVPPRPSEGSFRSSLESNTAISEPCNLRPAVPPGMDKNGSQISTRVPPFSQLHSVARSSSIPKPGTSSEIFPTYFPARTVTAPRLQSINATPPIIAGSRPSAAAVHTTPTHISSLASASVYEGPSSPDKSRKRHSSSPHFSESKVPRLVSTGSHLDDWQVTPSGGHSSVVDRGVQASYGTTALQSPVYIPQEPPASQLGKTVYTFQHPKTSASPFSSSQVLPTTNYLTMPSPETSMFVPYHHSLVSAPTPDSNSPTLPTFSATLPVVTTSRYSSPPINDATPSPSSIVSYPSGGSLVNHSGTGVSFKLEQYTKSTAKDGKEKKKGKGGAEVIPYVSIRPNQPLHSPESPQSNGHPGGFSTLAPTAAPPIISQQKQMNTSGSPVPSAQPDTQRVQREMLTQSPPHLAAATSTVNPVLLKNSALPNPATTDDRETKSRPHKAGKRMGSSLSSSPPSYMGANSTVGDSRRDMETGLEGGLANLKLGPMSSNRSNATSGAQRTTKSHVQPPANSSSLHNPTQRKKQPVSGTTSSSRPMNRNSGPAQRKSMPAQKPNSVNKPLPGQPQSHFNGRSAKGASQPRETERESRQRSSSPRNTQPQNRTSRRANSQKLKLSTTSAATSVPRSSSFGQKSGGVHPQASRNASSRGDRKTDHVSH